MQPHDRIASIEPVENFGWAELARAIWHFLRGLRLPWTILVTLLSLSYLYDFVPAWVIGQVVNILTMPTLSMEEKLGFVYQYAWFLGLTWILAAHLRLTVKNQLGNLSIEARYRAKVEGFERLMDYSLTWHQQENTGNKIQRITNGVAHLRDFLTQFTREIIFSAIAIPSIIIIYATHSLELFILVAVYALAFITNEWYFQRKIADANDAYNRSLEESSGTYFESANNVMTIKSLGVKDRAAANVNRNEAAARDHNIRIRLIGTRKWKVFQTINGFTYLFFVFILAQQYSLGLLGAGTILTLYSYLARLTKSAGDTGEIVVDALEHRSAIGRMMPIFWGDTHVRTGTKPFPAHWDTIEIRDGSFRYTQNDTQFHLQNLNLTIRRNEKLGVVGASGSGKSTLAKLLLGLYELEDGSFTIGSTDYYSIQHTQVARHISTVLQETELFNLSLRENLTLYKRVSDELLTKAIRIAQLEEVVAQLPNGLDTLIGEKGYKLSGGERQRVGIARAICSDAEILVLDEATSALDSKTEQAIQARLETELQKKTMVLIAHRLSTLKHVDRIIVFEKGRIVEEGTFKTLLGKKTSRFAKMYALQHRKGTAQN